MANDRPPAGPPLAAAQRIVVKIGSSLLIDRQTNELNRGWLAALAEDLTPLLERGTDVLLVSSGAIALGRRALSLPEGELRLEESQAAAAAGQIDLAHAYREILGAQGLKTAQILITLADTEERRRYLNARNTLETLFKVGAIPVVNENDTVATTEIRYGDNDRLAARVAAMVSADCLVLLSDIDGLYTADPRRDPSARLIEQVADITPEIEAMGGEAPARTAEAVGSGGMVTKLAAARIAVGAGCHVAIASGVAHHPLARLLAGERATWFEPRSTPRAARKNWIAASLAPTGTLTIDPGAEAALLAGRSLLPAGVKALTGTFGRGDAVIVADLDGRELARGLVAYAADDAEAILGRKTRDIEAVLGYRGRSEMIHRDDLVVTAVNRPASPNSLGLDESAAQRQEEIGQKQSGQETSEAHPKRPAIKPKEKPV
ncbi:MAG: glutamate 5-kinase [Pseudomonadota bacterium]